MKRLLLILAFLLTFMISLLYALPARWVLAQAPVQQQLPKELKINKASGSWWMGQADVSLASPEKVRLGLLSWRLNFLPLLSGDLAVDLHWQKLNSNLAAKVKLSGEQLMLSDINGQIQLAQLASFDPQLAMLSDAKGQLHLRELFASVSLAQSPIFPQMISGKLAVIDFAALGVEIPLVEVVPEVKNQQLILAVDGSGEGWQLKGQVKIKGTSHQTQLKLTARSAELMPQWVTMFMRQSSPTVAEFKQQGQFR